MLVETKIKEGLQPSEARRAALIEMGGVEQVHRPTWVLYRTATLSCTSRPPLEVRKDRETIYDAGVARPSRTAWAIARISCAGHRGALDPAERLGLAHLLLRHQEAPGPVDRLARLEAVGETGDLAREGEDLGVSGDRQLDGRRQVVPANSLTRYAIAPASRPNSMRSRWLNAVSMTTGAICSATIAPAASMPSSWAS